MRAVVVVYDVACPNCSAIARELPDLLRVPMQVRSCRDPLLPAAYPTLKPSVLACGRPALGVVAADGSVRWWLGLTGAVGVLPVVRPRNLPDALRLLWTAWRVGRAR